MAVKRQKKLQPVSIPEDIMFDIFLRLPTPTLFPCQLVSKDWYNLINNPVFINLHKSKIEKQPPPFFLSIRDNKFPVFFDVSDDHKVRKSIRIGLHDVSKKDKIEVVGSANGLLCISLSKNRDVFYVCNPLTREVIRLCKPPHHERKDGFFRYTPDGFAYDETTKTYKVFHTWCCDKLFRTGIEVYDVGASEWRRGKEEYIPNCIRVKSSQVVCDGAVHWDIAMSTQSLEISRWCIGAIHIANENFRTFEPPFRGVGITNRTLGSLKGRLCVMDLGSMNSLIVWSMREYGDETSWYQEYSICTEDIWPFHFAGSLPIVDDTSILVRSFDQQEGYYDPEKKELKRTGDAQWSESRDVFHHVGSLASPRPKRFKPRTKGFKNKTKGQGLKSRLQ